MAARAMALTPEYPIETERLLLRPFTPADIDPFLRLRSDPVFMRYMPFELATRADIERSVASRMELTRFAGKDSGLALAVELAGGGAFIGDVLLFHYDPAVRTAELGFSLDPAQHGKGYATEAARALLRWGFAAGELHRVVARCDARNTASARALQRLGFRPEGHLRQDALVRGEWTDTLLFGLLAQEWAAASTRRDAPAG